MAVSAIAGLASIGSAMIAAGKLAIGWAAALKAFAIGASLSAVSRALAPQPSLGAQLRGITQTTRNPAGPRKLVYGQMRVGGQVVFIGHSGADNKYLHLVLVFATHEIESYEEFWFNDKKVYDNGAVLSDWSDVVTITKFDGSQTTAASSLTSAFATWTSNHILNGMAYAHLRLEWDADKFPQGVPNISAVIKGKKVYDPRDTNQSATNASTWTYSQNPALCLRDYLVDNKYGLGEDHALIDTTALTAAANLCEESISLDGGGTQDRYKLNGVIDTANQIKDNIEQMLSAMGGRISYSGGKYFIAGAEYNAPTLSFDEADCVAEIQLQTKQSRRSAYNGVKGIFVSEEKNYKVLDYPAQISSTYATEDGDPIYLDMALPFVTNNVQAQRIAKIALLKSRQQTIIGMTVNLKGLRVKVGDTINVSNTHLGYSNKVFEIVDYSLAIADGGNLAVNLTCIETASAVYDWTTSDQEDFLSGGELTLYDGRTVDNVTSLTATEIGLRGPDGALKSSVQLAWTAPTDAFIEFYTVRYNKNGTTEYFEIQTRETNALLEGLDITSNYDFRVKAQNLIGVQSTGTSITNRALNGDTTAPSAPTSVILTAGINQITCEWTNPTDIDLAFVEVHVTTTSATPSVSASPTAKVGGEEYIATGLSEATRYFHLRAVDFSGNKSGYTTQVSATSLLATGADIGTGAVDTDEIATGAVTEVKIEDGAVTADKITVGELSAITADIGDITAGTLQANTSTPIPDANDSPSGSETGAFIDLDNGKFVFGDANKHLLYDGSTLLVKGELEADILDVIDATITGQLTANAISAGAVTVASLSAGVFAEFDDRYGTSGGFYVTDTDEFFDGSGTKYVTVGTVAHSTDDIYFECRLNHSWSYNRNDTGDKLKANVSFEYSTDNSTWTTVPSSTTQVATATGVVAQYATLYSIAEDITYTMTGSALTAGNYYFRVKIVAQNTTNAFQLAALGSGNGVPIAFEVQESSGLSAAGGNADTLDGLDSTQFLRSDTDDTFSGNLTITGDLILQGGIDQYNVTNLTVEDKTITVNAGSTQALSDGAGLIVDRGTAADASITWDETNDRFEVSHDLRADDLRIGEWSANTAYAGLFHANHSGEEYILVSSDSHTFISATTGNDVRIRGGNNISTYEVRVYPDQDATASGNKIWHAGDFTSTNVTNWNTAYTYSQVGHLPLAGGTMTGTLNMGANAISSTGTISSGAITASGPVSITGNSSYVGNYGYSTLVLQDGSGYAGINFRHGNKNWLIRKNGVSDDLEFVYSDNASAANTGTYTELFHILHDGGFDFKSGNFSNVGAITTSGDITVGSNRNINLSGDLKMTGTDSYIWVPNTTNGFTGFYSPVNGVVARYENNTNGWGFMGNPESGYAVKVHGALYATTDVRLDSALKIGATTVIASTRRIYASDGTVAKAAFSFDGESNTGMYKYGTNQIGFTAGGSLIAYIQSGATYGLVVQSKISATGGNSDNWNTAYGWGDHSTAGYVTNALQTNDNITVGTISSGAITSTGNVLVDGNFVIDTDTGSQKFQVNRLGTSTSHNQALRVHVDDSNVVFESQQDETDRYGGYQFNSKHGTTVRTRLQITAGSDSEVTMYASNGNGAWRWDGTNLRQGINKTAPDYTLDVAGTINGSNYRLGTIEVIDTSRNLTNIGTISSGQITSSGSVTAGNGSTSLGFYVGTTQVIQGSTRNLVNIGTINSGAITSSGAITGTTVKETDGGDGFTEIGSTNFGYFSWGIEIANPNNGYRAIRFAGKKKYFVLEADVLGTSGANHTGMFWGNADGTAIYAASTTGYKTTHQNSTSFHIRDINTNSNQETYNPAFSPADGAWHHQKIMATPDGYVRIWIDGDLKFEETGYIPSAEGYLGFINYAGTVRFANIRCRTINEDEAQHYSQHIGNANSAYADDDRFLKLANDTAGNVGTLVTADNGNTWLNADGGKDLWLNWVSLNNKSSKADLQVGDGNYGSAILTVAGSSRRVGINEVNPSFDLDVEGSFGVRNSTGISLRNNSLPSTPLSTEVQLFEENNGLVVRGENQGNAINFVVRDKFNNNRLEVQGNGLIRQTIAGNLQDGTYYSGFTMNITGASTFGGLRFDRNGTANYRVGLRNDGKFQIANFNLSANVDDQFVISAGGDVGINTSAPVAKFEVVNAGSVQSQFSYNSTNYTQVNYDGTNTVGGDALFRRASAEKLRLTATGATITGQLALTSLLNVEDIKAKDANGLNLQTDEGTKRVIVYDSGTVVINETGSNADFRVESDLDENMLFVDASANAIGMGDPTPYSADWGTTTATRQVAIRGSNYGVLHIRGSNNNVETRFSMGAGGGNFYPAYDDVNNQHRLIYTQSEAVFNDGGADYDFRVESDTKPNAFLVNAGTNRVGINTGSPASNFSIKADGNGYSNGLTIEDFDSSTFSAITHVNGTFYLSATGSADTLIFDSSHNATFAGISQHKRDIRSAGQIRATGWYNDAASTDYTGLAFEIGVSGSKAYGLSYNRSTASYGPMRFDATTFEFNRASTFNLMQGDFQIGGTTVIDSSRDLVNIAKYNVSSSSYFVGNTNYGYRFNNAADTLNLVILDDSGNLDVIHGNVEIGGSTAISSTQRFYASSGTSVKAAYSFDGESNTGWYKPAAGEIAFISQGVERLHVKSTGELEVPTGRVNIDGAAAAFDALLLGSTTQTSFTNVAWYSNSGNAQIWKAGSGYTNFGGASSLNIYNSNGKIAFHPANTQNVVQIDTNSLIMGAGKTISLLQASGTLISHGAYSDAIGFNGTYGTYIGGNGGRYVYSGGANTTNGGTHPYYSNGTTISNITHDKGQINNTYVGQHEIDVSSQANGGLRITGNNNSGPQLGIKNLATGGTQWQLISNGSGNTDGAGRLQLWNTTQGFAAATFGHTADTATNIYNRKVIFKNVNIGLGLNARPSGSIASYSGKSGLFWHSDATNDYGIYRTDDGWSSPNYSQIEIRWPTGIILDGGSSYGKSGVDIASGNLKIGGTDIITSARHIQAIPNFKLTDGGNFYAWTSSVTSGGAIHLPRAGQISFYGDASSYHAICSRNQNGAESDDIRINSYADVWINLDSNNNNDTNADFVIGRHGGGTGVIDYLLSVSGANGDLVTEGNVTAYGSPSDIRLKENIERIADPIEKVKQLDGITFDYKKDGSRSTGLVAQQLLEVLPEVVYETEDLHTGDTHYAVRYGNVVGLLVEAMKEQQETIESLTKRIEELENGDNKDN